MLLNWFKYLSLFAPFMGRCELTPLHVLVLELVRPQACKNSLMRTKFSSVFVQSSIFKSDILVRHGHIYVYRNLFILTIR